MTVLLFIVILGALIFVHELGHFLLAKLFGIRVDEFALGFPPRLFSRVVGETRYALNLLPFGGYVKIFGEDMTAIPSSDPDKSRSFSAQNRFKQAMVLVGGVSMNVIFAWLLLSAGFLFGATVVSDDYPNRTLIDERLLVVSVLPDSPAFEAGLQEGDVVRGIRDESETISMPSVTVVQQFVADHDAREVVFDIERSGVPSLISAIPKEGVVEGQAGVGISMEQVGTLRLSIVGSLIEGMRRTSTLLVLTVQGLGGFLYELFLFQADFSEVAGPVGIAILVGDAQSLGLFYLLSFTAIISLNLAVLNLIPFPALDGGRLFFVLIESVIRRPLPVNFIKTLNTVGFFLLIGLILFITYKDIAKLF